MTTGPAELVVDARCTLGEGPVWSPRHHALIWTDIARSRLWMYTATDDSTESWPLPDRLCCLALCASGRLLLGLAKGLYWAALDAAPGEPIAVSLVAPVEADLPSTRLNDGRTDRAGNFVFGTLNEHPARAPIGSFYQYSSRHGLRRLDLGDVAISNSICFGLDGATMYFCDTPSRTIRQCDYDAERAVVRNVREFVRLGADAGRPDGSIVDRDGCLWNAEWGGGRVRRYTPQGVVDHEVLVPVPNPTCPAFGGRDLDQLYVTSSRQDMSEEQLGQMPAAGGVFRVQTSVRGVPDQLFQDQ